MRIVDAVSFESVMRHFNQEHAFDPTDVANTNDEAEDRLRQAHALGEGRWHLVSLTEADVRSVILPWHLGEDGAVELIPPTGLTVTAALDHLADLGPSYADANPRCDAKLTWQRQASPQPLFLTTRAVAGRDYARLTVREGLIHLDGLHRVLAWGQDGRLASERGTQAYVAGLRPADARGSLPVPH